MINGNTQNSGGDYSFTERLGLFLARHRFSISLLAHGVLFFLALLLAYLIRYTATGARTSWFRQSFLPWVPFFVGVKLVIFGLKGQFRADWMYAGIRDVVNILIAMFYFLLIGFAMVVLFRYLPEMLERQAPPFFRSYSRGVLFLDFLAAVFLTCTARLAFRLYHEELRPVAAEGARRALIVGAGHTAELVVREISRMHVERYRVIGLIDDNPTRQHISIHGVPVLGATDDIAEICEEYEIDEILIALPSATQKELRRIIELCSGTTLKFQSLPSVGDLIGGRVTVSQIRPVDIADLLGRDTVELDNEAIGRFLRGRNVLITGAGGSIGSEMARQTCPFGPRKLVLVEQAETPLFDIDNELRADHGDLEIVPCICNIADRDRVMALWNTHRPDVVIHAAAHKHVPMMERNPCEAVKNNVLGTKNVADASCEHGVSEFVMISTDKAVNPSSIMGASKRVAEIYTQALNGQPHCKTKFKAVRFGNVLGSSGSVVPAFRKQIAAGGPVTVTHPDMTRYFMTIPEAAQLVLQAAATGEGGQIFLLDMGEPVKIVDLARQMITLSGFRPGEDIDIVFTGIRPGEKLFEELRTEGEDILPTVHPKVRIWNSRPARWDFAAKSIESVQAMSNTMDRSEIVAALRKIVPEYEPLNPPEEITSRPDSSLKQTDEFVDQADQGDTPV